MSEEVFNLQEQKRLDSEARLKAFCEGEPLPNTLAEFMQKYGGELAENPLLKEFLKRLVKENYETVEALRRLLTEQN